MIFLGAILLAAAAAAPAPPTLREKVNALDAPALQKAVEAIQTNFIGAATLDDTARQRALLEGLIRRNAPAISIIDGKAADVPPPLPFVAEILDGRIGYLRPGALDAATLAQADATLAKFGEKKLAAVVLDLRAIPRTHDFDGAAELAKRFVAKGTLLFSVQKPVAKQERIVSSDRDPLFNGVLVVLVDGDTAGGAEALAATLRANARAVIVGSDTAGEAVEYAEFPLDEGRSLRVAVAQAVLPGGVTLIPGGVKPDVPVSLPPAVQAEIFEKSASGGVSQFVFDTEKVRLNEAALVANTNPEIDGTSTPPAADVPRDTVLQRAVDLITAIEFFGKR